MKNYPPLPYPRMPRYRVNKHLGEPWREVSDAELLAFGENPADYTPEERPVKQPSFLDKIAHWLKS